MSSLLKLSFISSIHVAIKLSHCSSTTYVTPLLSVAGPVPPASAAAATADVMACCSDCSCDVVGLMPRDLTIVGISLKSAPRQIVLSNADSQSVSC